MVLNSLFQGWCNVNDGLGCILIFALIGLVAVIAWLVSVVGWGGVALLGIGIVIGIWANS